MLLIIDLFLIYTYFELDLIEPMTPNKLLCGWNLEVINIVNDTSPMVDLKVTKQEQYLQTLNGYLKIWLNYMSIKDGVTKTKH